MHWISVHSSVILVSYINDKNEWCEDTIGRSTYSIGILYHRVGLCAIVGNPTDVTSVYCHSIFINTSRQSCKSLPCTLWLLLWFIWFVMCCCVRMHVHSLQLTRSVETGRHWSVNWHVPGRPAPIPHILLTIPRYAGHLHSAVDDQLVA